MRAAVIGVVQHVHITRFHTARVACHDRFDRLAHRPQVNWHVRSVGDQIALRIEQRAGKIKPLFDVDGVGGVLQLQTHLLGNVHEQVVEHFQHHRVYLRAHRNPRFAGFDALNHQMIQRRHTRLPTRLNHRRGVFLGNDGRASDDVTGPRVFAHHQIRIPPFAATEQTHAGCGGCRARFGHRHGRLIRRIARRDGFHRHRLDHQAALIHQKRKTLAVGGFKRGLDAGCAAVCHHQSRVGAFVAHMHSAMNFQRGAADALASEFV